MTKIEIITEIRASQNIVFDLARNIDFHQKSASQTSEKAIDGVTSGLINLHQTVTWRGKHFGFYLEHQSVISEMILYDYFIDEQLTGHFKTFKHQHIFSYQNGLTIMTDMLKYETPYGVFGKIFDYFFLKKHLTNFLIHRNQVLKSSCENL